MFEELPLTISLDYVPTLYFGTGSPGFQGGLGNLAVRYILDE